MYITWLNDISHDSMIYHMTEWYITWFNDISHDPMIYHMIQWYITWSSGTSHDSYMVYQESFNEGKFDEFYQSEWTSNQCLEISTFYKALIRAISYNLSNFISSKCLLVRILQTLRMSKLSNTWSNMVQGNREWNVARLRWIIATIATTKLY